MFPSSVFGEMFQNANLYQQQQMIHDLNSLLNDTTVSSSYGVDNFDLSLLGSDYNFENFPQQFVTADVLMSSRDLTNNLALSVEIDISYQNPVQTQFKQEDTFDWHQQQYYLQSSSLLSPISPAATIHGSPSPCPSVDYPMTIKQEHNLFLPPSPPDSIGGVPSPQSMHHCDHFKIEQFDDNLYSNQTVLSPNCRENTIDIKFLLDERNQKHQQDHQVLRELLDDTTYQRKHNLKPLALESLFGGLTQRGDIEPVISLALEHAKREVQATCKALNIAPDPTLWTEEHVQTWINSTMEQFKLEPISRCELVFPENGQSLAAMSDEEFIRRAPQIGSILHAQLEIWKATYADGSCIDNNTLTSSTNSSSAATSTATVTAQNSSLSHTSTWPKIPNADSDMSDDEESDLAMETDLIAVKTEVVIEAEAPSISIAKPKTPKKHHSHLQKRGSPTSSHIHLWQFLKELLSSSQVNGTAIRWIDRSKGIFKIEDSVRVARLWGRRKNRPAMNYDKLSRSIRQYYKKGIMKKTERSQRLVYQFCHPYCL